MSDPQPPKVQPAQPQRTILPSISSSSSTSSSSYSSSSATATATPSTPATATTSNQPKPTQSKLNLYENVRSSSPSQVAAADTLHALSRSRPSPSGLPSLNSAAAGLSSILGTTKGEYLYHSVRPISSTTTTTITNSKSANSNTNPAKRENSYQETSGSPLRREVEVAPKPSSSSEASGSNVKFEANPSSSLAGAAKSAGDLGQNGGSTSNSNNDLKGKAKVSKDGKRKKANRACFHCQKAHLTCDDSRPCQRCVRKGLADSCTDGLRKKAKYLLDDDEIAELKRQKAEKKQAKLLAANELNQQQQQKQQQQQQQQQQQNQAPAGLDSTLSSASVADPSSPAHDLIHGHSHIDSGQSVASHQSDPTFDLAFDPTYNFGSEATSLEYSILSSMLNGTDMSLLGSDHSPDFQTSPAALQVDNYTDYDGGSGRAEAWNLADPSLLGSLSTPPGAVNSTAFTDAISAIGGANDNGGTSFDQAGNPSFAQQEQTASIPANGGTGENLTSFSNLEMTSPNNTKSNEAVGRGDGFGADEVKVDGSSLQGEEGAGLVANGQGGGGASSDVTAAGGTVGGGGAGPGSIGRGSVGRGSAGRGSSMDAGEQVEVANALATRRAKLDQSWKNRVAKVYKDNTKPFPYTEGYHFLLKYATEKYEYQDVLRIVRALAVFRPSLIALQMPLSEDDEIFVERSFQRTILEFEKLISFSGTPTVVWRRTCEICVVGAEFCMLTQWSREQLMGKYIYEFMDKDSMLDYWEKFASHAFENTTQSVMTTCVLLTPNNKPVPCSWSFTIKRDVFDLPALIVGNFLPVLS
ncbi:hypothetical protein IE53DRAFT_326140 [Violaceomyces palustris]|uniref:Uncharacterized protein n=1 Tax=Violaceomyces palustris TaxID=1673888 RepID=A0ACD0P3P5_9BASI|nr:hypothetical protein IE53DRAFT_326140 [Violaceomyces palustris]